MNVRWLILWLSLSLFSNCNNMTNEKYTNKLIDETSPYLLQHAHNPVNWYPWGEEALQRAKEENKPILLSIGYSSCHWCHVMAHESFENEEIAQMMNERFINIKLDREERPDIDNIYMDAVQTMGLRGGWPLNVFLTPDQKPFYGGTYFPPEQWKKLILSIESAYKNKHDQLYESAVRFAESLQQSEAEKYGLSDEEIILKMDDYDSAVSRISKQFDDKWGGLKRAPKFPMPVIWNFLLSYAHASENQQTLDHVLFTLDKIAAGGIYDHIGGGFARYAVDGEWHVPHFEKMLYDNGQLLSLYANAYKLTKKKSYLKVLTGTAEWLQREMLTESGGLYSALDADSEGEEGKFYVWTFDEVRNLLEGYDFSVVAEYYDVVKKGNWEEGKNVLRKLEDDAMLASELHISEDSLESIVESFNQKALEERSKRERPGLDSKILSGWNGLTLTGLCDGYQATGEAIFKELAEKNAQFIKEQMIKDGKLIRTYGKNVTGFLEDYASVIQAFIKYYETFGEEEFLHLAHDLTKETITHYFDEKEHFFFYSSNESESLIARKKEIFDNVIPASNSIMADNLYRLGLMLDDDSLKSISYKMTGQVNKLINGGDTEYLSNWAHLGIMIINPTAEVIIVGPDAQDFAAKINQNYLPNKILMTSKSESNLPLFEFKTANQGRTTIYVCFDKVCRQPVYTVEDALRAIHEGK